MNTPYPLNLNGEEGNSEVLLQIAADVMTISMSMNDATDILKEMRSGTYEQLLEIFAKNCSAHVTLYRDEVEYRAALATFEAEYRAEEVPRNEDTDEWPCH
jgi:hypothetical protein